MATIRDEEDQKGLGLSEALRQQLPNQQEQPQEQQPPIEGTGQTQIGASQGAKAPQAPVQKQQKAGTGTFANLKSYLQAAQGGGRVSQAATQRVQNVAGQAQKGIQQAQKAFGTKMEAGSLKGMGTAAEEAKGIIGTATGTTYQAPPQPQKIKPYDPEKTAKIWEDLKRNPDGTITNKDGSPLNTTPSDKVAGVIPEQAPVQTPGQPAATTQPQQYFTPEQQQRFAEIINAQYQGPASLQQAGLYEQAAKKAQTAQQASQQAQTAGGREQILRDIFGRNRDYSRGQSKLDALLLNTSQQGVQSLQEQAQKAGNIQQQLQEAQNISANEAARRAGAIQGISSGAREAFTGARTAEEIAADEKIKAIQDNWNKLPEYFKNVLQESKATGQTTSRVGNALPRMTAGNRYYDEQLGKTGLGTTYNLSKEEASILGLTPGAGLYGLTPEMIQASPAASGSELITKDQLSRQLALAELAKLDTSKGLQKDLMYSDLEKAGTKDILSSLNASSIQKQMLEKQQEMEKAIAEKSVGISTRIGSGDYFGNKGYNYLDLLKSGGYTDSGVAGLIPEDIARTNLRNIAEGGAYAPTEITQQIPGYIQRALEKLQGNTNLTQSTRALQKVQEEMKKYGGLDTSQIVENDATKSRAAALRELLSGIYKK